MHPVFMTKPGMRPESLLQSLLSADRQFTSTSFAEMAEALKVVGLSDISMRCGGWDQARPRNDEFSLDEQTLQAMVRILLAKPVMVALDHPSATLDRDQQRRVVTAMSARGIGCVFLGCDDSDAAPYDLILRIAGDSTCR